MCHGAAVRGAGATYDPLRAPHIPTPSPQKAHSGATFTKWVGTVTASSYLIFFLSFLFHLFVCFYVGCFCGLSVQLVVHEFQVFALPKPPPHSFHMQ